MALPPFNADGDLPPGLYRATMEEVAARFGGQNAARKQCTTSLRRILDLARDTGQFERMIVFGSYISEKPSPNDVDIILVMSDAFNPSTITGESRRLFDHAVAQTWFGASIF